MGVPPCTFCGQEGDCDTWGSSGCGVLGIPVFCELWPPNVLLRDAGSFCDLSHCTPGSTPVWVNSTITSEPRTHDILQRESGASTCTAGGTQQVLGNAVTQSPSPAQRSRRDENGPLQTATAFATEARERSRSPSSIPEGGLPAHLRTSKEPPYWMVTLVLVTNPPVAEVASSRRVPDLPAISLGLPGLSVCRGTMGCNGFIINHLCLLHRESTHSDRCQ